jgi:hypothetical protein
MDGSGTERPDAAEIMADFLANGCVTNRDGEPGLPGFITEINQNAVFDAARRLSQVIRIISRQQLVGYAVENGKSCLWFKRYALGMGQPSDWTEVTSGSIEAYRTYEVRATGGGTVDYDVGTYADGDRFAGLPDVVDFTVTGTAAVWVITYGQLAEESGTAGADLFDGLADAITSTAPARGWTNEWVAHVDLIPYRNGEGTAYKPAAFADYWAQFERAHFWNHGIARNPELLDQFCYGQGLPRAVMFSEAPTGYRYANNRRWDGSSWNSVEGLFNLNQVTCDPEDDYCANFFKSCRIYEPPVQVESVLSLVEDSVSLVKVTFTGRLHSTAGESGGAPASIARDRSGWVWATIAAEPFRSVENGIRLYLLHIDSGTSLNPTTRIPGDCSLDTYFSPDTWGAIYPRFFFTKLIPKPFIDGNATQNADDTALWADVFAHLDLQIRAMTSGFIDPASSNSLNGCAVETLGESEYCQSLGHGLYAYTFESLCLQAFGGSSFHPLPSVATAETPAGQTRSDKPPGYGPMPNTLASAEVFNQFSAAVNLLTHVPVMLPMSMLSRTYHYADRIDVTDEQVDGCGSRYGETHYFGSYNGPLPAAQTLVNDSGWIATGGDPLSASNGVGLFLDYAGVQWYVQADRFVTEFKFEPTDPDSLHAIPSAWRSLLDTAAGTLFCRYDVSATPAYHATHNPCDEFTCTMHNAGVTGARCVTPTGRLEVAASPNSGLVYTVVDTSGCSEDGAWNRTAWLTPLANPEVFIVVPLLGDLLPPDPELPPGDLDAGELGVDASTDDVTINCLQLGVDDFTADSFLDADQLT